METQYQEHYIQIRVSANKMLQNLWALATIDSPSVEDVRQYGRLHQRFDRVLNAFDRVLVNDFGICLQCQQQIARIRLQSLPYVELCFECQRSQEGRVDTADASKMLQ